MDADHRDLAVHHRAGGRVRERGGDVGLLHRRDDAHLGRPDGDLLGDRPHRSIRDTDAKPDVIHVVGSTAGFLVALVVMLLVPAAGYDPLLVLLLVGPLIRVWRWHARSRGCSAR